MKKLIFLSLFWFALSPLLHAESLLKLDYSKRLDGDAKDWLIAEDWTFQAGAKSIKPLFQEGKLIIIAKEEQLGQLVKRVNLENAKTLIIKWGVNKFPKNASWDNSVEREAIMVSVSFGKEIHGSGVLFLPSLPRFIGFFLGETEKEGQAYKGRYYKKSADYYCLPCGNKATEEVTTEVDLEDYYKKSFGTGPMPYISSLSLEFDTRDTGPSEAFIRSIEIIAKDSISK
ncbi:MAG: hypothetical protein QNL04_05915 [SAR324 cluster bacterium]|nr:hypothetical protein [SAR324 cluster bacterium]